MFCLMPDHFHMVWMGLFEESDQLLAMKHFRKSVNESLARIGVELQDQAYDHVLSDVEKQEQAFRNVCEYVSRNPEKGNKGTLHICGGPLIIACFRPRRFLNSLKSRPEFEKQVPNQ